jgi:uncharacterized protein (TIGR03000 family)
MTPRIRTLAAVALVLGLVAAALAQQPAAQPPAGKPMVKSKVKVIVPQDDAELVVEGKKTETRGKERLFDTPDLEQGTRYLYDFVVTWRPDKFTTVTRKSTRKFTGGQELTVDLTNDEGNDKATTTLAAPSDDMIDELLKAAKITKDDVAFEPDFKDIRTLTAVSKAGAKRAVGLTADADKAKAANEQIKAGMLEGKVEVVQAEPADGKDYAQGTVALLYLTEDRGQALLPVLLRDLKAGSRVVSLRFKLGDWPPATTTPAVNKDGVKYEVYTWTVTDEAKAKYGKK